MADTRQRRWRLRILIIGFFLAIAAGLFFLLLVVTDRYIAQQGPKTLLYDLNSFRQFTLTPGQTYRHGDVSFTINQLGLRGAAPGAREGHFRIFVVGGSSVFDHWLGEGQSWPERLGSILEQGGFPGVESFNAGVPGYSSRHTLSLYLDRLRALQPDMVIFYQGWNDLKYMRALQQGVSIDRYFAVRDLSRYRFLTARRPLRNWYALREMIGIPLRDPDPLGEGSGSAASATGNAIPLPSNPDDRRSYWVSSPGMRYWRNNVETLVWRMIQDDVVPVLVAQNTLVTADLDQEARDRIRYDLVDLDHEDVLILNTLMAEELADIAKRFNIPWIDLRPTFNGRADVFSDHVHLRPVGSQQFAVALAQALVPVLEREIRRADESGVMVSPVARWRFEDPGPTVHDSGPHGLHGRIEQGVHQVEGYRGQGYQFDGDAGQIVIPANRELELTRNFHIEAWVNLGGQEPQGSQGLVIKGGSYHLAIRQGRPAFYGYGLEPQTWYSGRTPIPVDGWHRIVAEYVNGEVRVALDGDIQRWSATGEVQRSTRPLILGDGFQGRLDEVILAIRVESDSAGSEAKP